MDNLDAPQWADFIAPSPQVPLDDFFMRKHEAHEYRNNPLFGHQESPSQSDSSMQMLNGSCAANDTVLQQTPVKSKSSKAKNSSCKKNIVKETTYENALTEAMNNLQLSFKMMKSDKSMNKSCLLDSPATFKTPKRVTRSMCAKAATPKCDLDESHYLSLEHLDKSSGHNHDHDHDHDEENADVELQPEPVPKPEPEPSAENVNANEAQETNDKVDCDSSASEQTSQFNLEVTATSTEPDSSCDKWEIESREKQDDGADAVHENQNELPPANSKIVTSFKVKKTESTANSSFKKVRALTGNAWHRQVKRRMSLSNQRRMSVTKASTVTTTTTTSTSTTSKYVSMAEAVTKFQRATPQRFHTVNVKSTKTEMLRRQSLKLTRARSPALMCRNRARPVTAMSRDEKEKLELEKLRQNQIKANPVRKDILNKPAPLKKVAKKMITNPEPFHLTQTKKGQPPQPPKQPSQNQEFKRTHRVHAKTVPSIVSTNEKSVVIKEEEVLHFGIPLEPVNKKKTTKVMPFSFEERNRALQAKKQEKLKQLKETEQQKVKPEFHARPVPAAVKTPANVQPAPKPSSTKKITIARSLSFEERNKEIQKKKEEKIKQMLENEKKMRSFKAQKVPEFKPVMVRGRSKDNLHKKSNENLSVKSQSLSDIAKKAKDNSLKKSNENLAMKKSNGVPALKKSYGDLTMKNLIKKPIPFVAPKKVVPPPAATENQENKRQGGAVPKIMEPKCKLSQKAVAVLSELNTDKRAKQRKEFEEQMKKRETDEIELKKKEEQERLEREKAENMELRKKMEIKARPMPVYKQLNITKSSKPLTEAQSPHWTKPKRSSFN